MSITTDRPTIHSLSITHGVAGQVQVRAAVSYGDDRFLTWSLFIGNTYATDGGPVLFQAGRMDPDFVIAPERFGIFALDPEAWVRRFFGA